MKLLFFGINYAPELTGIGKYTGEMATYYAENAHEVEVITAPPYYPNWKISAGYRNWWSKEKVNGVKVMRCPLYVPQRPTGIKRILQEITFFASSLRYWLPRMFRRYDAIIVVSPPFHLGIFALFHGWLWGTVTVNHIQDLQIDAARKLGMIKSKGLLKVMTWLEQQLLRRFTHLSTISEGMKRVILTKVSGLAQVIMFPNWVDSKVVYPVSKENTKRAEWGFGPDDRIVMYSGNLGEKQGVTGIPRLAKRFEANSKTKFVVIGDGGAKGQLMEEAEELQLTNILFLPLQPLDSLASVLSTADVHLVLQKAAAADLVMPSKLTNILAVGGHALVTANAGTTLHDIVTDHKLGTLASAEDDDDLSMKLRSIIKGDKSFDAAGAEDFANQNLKKSTILDAYLAAIIK